MRLWRVQAACCLRAWEYPCTNVSGCRTVHADARHSVRGCCALCRGSAWLCRPCRWCGNCPVCCSSSGSRMASRSVFWWGCRPLVNSCVAGCCRCFFFSPPNACVLLEPYKQLTSLLILAWRPCGALLPMRWRTVTRRSTARVVDGECRARRRRHLHLPGLKPSWLGGMGRGCRHGPVRLWRAFPRRLGLELGPPHNNHARRALYNYGSSAVAVPTPAFSGTTGSGVAHECMVQTNV